MFTKFLFPLPLSFKPSPFLYQIFCPPIGQWPVIFKIVIRFTVNAIRLIMSATSGKAGGLREVERPKAAKPFGR